MPTKRYIIYWNEIKITATSDSRKLNAWKFVAKKKGAAFRYETQYLI